MSPKPRLVFVVAALVLGFALPAQAHSWSDLNDWLADWDARFEAAWIAVNTDASIPHEDPDALTAEYEDMRARHPAWSGDYLAPPPEPDPIPDTHARAPEPVSSPTPTAPPEAAVPVKAPSPPPVASGVEQWRSLVATYFAADQVDRALCIMSHESGGNPSAKNPRSTAAGLFQFLKSTWDNMVPGDITGGSYDSGMVYDPTANVRSAAWLLGAAGWSQWSPWNRGLCR